MQKRPIDTCLGSTNLPRLRSVRSVSDICITGVFFHKAMLILLAVVTPVIDGPSHDRDSGAMSVRIIRDTIVEMEESQATIMGGDKEVST